MTVLGTTIDEYLGVRRALGFKLERERNLLPDFVAFVHRHGGSYITTELALRWVTEPNDASATWLTHRLTIVRGFARYVRAHDPRTEIPPRDLLTKSVSRAEPYVYSDDDVRALMAATAFRRGLGGPTYATLIGLLAATGMRVGEAISLNRCDVDWRQRAVVIRSGKFGKSRELPPACDHGQGAGGVRLASRSRRPTPTQRSIFRVGTERTAPDL